ncbi:MAG: hypothetical protein ACLRM8_03940 [Alistipes sp.]
MRKILCILSCLLVAGCTSFDRNPYDGALRELRVTAVYPEGYAGYLREGVAVKLSDRNTGNVYTALTDAQGHAGFRVAAGHYRLSVLDRPDASSVFNGAVEQVDLAGADRNVSVELKYAKPGTILIKEIYSGGCPQDRLRPVRMPTTSILSCTTTVSTPTTSTAFVWRWSPPTTRRPPIPGRAPTLRATSFSAITPPYPTVSGCSRARGQISRCNPARMPWWPTMASTIRRPIPSR